MNKLEQLNILRDKLQNKVLLTYQEQRTFCNLCWEQAKAISKEYPDKKYTNQEYLSLSNSFEF